MSDPVQAQIAAMQSQVLSNASSGAANTEAQRLAGSAGPYQQVGIDYLGGKRTALGDVTQMLNGSGGASSGSVTSGASRNRASDLQGRINAAGGAFRPELVAGYTSADGQWHPPTYTKPAPGQEVPGSIAGAGGTFDPGLISGDPRYQLLEQQRQALEDRKATAGQDVEAAYINQESMLRGQQNSAVGTSTMQLARMGALGTTASGLNYLQSMDRRHVKELSELGIQKARAVEQAKAQLDDRQFDLVDKQLELADQIQERYEQSRTRQIDNLTKLSNLEAAKRQALREGKQDYKDELSFYAGIGYTAEDFPEDYLAYRDEEQGLPVGTSAKLFDLAQAERAAAAEDAQFEREGKLIDREIKKQELGAFEYEQADKLVSILSKVPSGTPITLNGIEYAGWDVGSLKQGIEVNDSGIASGWTFNPATKEWSVQSLGNIGASKDSWTNIETNQGWMRQNQRTGALVPLEAGLNAAQEAIPDGTVWGEAWGRANAGQCGAFVNDLTGLGVGNEWETKQAKCDPSIGTTQNPINVGDVIVQKMGTTGHIAIINSMKEVPATPENPMGLMFRLSESNMIPPNGRQTSSTRWIAASDPSITGFARGKLPPFLASGPDTVTPVKTSGLQVVTAEDKRLAADLAKETRAADRQKFEDMNKLITDDLARELQVPIGTRFSDIQDRILPPKGTKAEYSYQEGADPETGKPVLYAIDKATNEATPVTIKTGPVTAPVSSTPSQARVGATTPQKLTILKSSDKADEENKKMSAGELKNWQELYPNAGITGEDTLAQARAKSSAATSSTSGAKPLTPQAKSQYEDALAAIKALREDDGMSGAVGFGLGKTVGWIASGAKNYEPLPGTPAYSFKAKLDTLKANLTAPNLSLLKGLGAMSDRELNLIASTVGSLDLNMSEKAFEAELDRIEKKLGLILQPPTNSASSTSDKIRVRLKSTGGVGSIPADKFDPNLFERL